MAEYFYHGDESNVNITSPLTLSSSKALRICSWTACWAGVKPSRLLRCVFRCFLRPPTSSFVFYEIAAVSQG